jgi:hypothetical protein
VEIILLMLSLAAALIEIRQAAAATAHSVKRGLAGGVRSSGGNPAASNILWDRPVAHNLSEHHGDFSPTTPRGRSKKSGGIAVGASISR